MEKIDAKIDDSLPTFNMSMFPNPQDSSCCQDKSSSCAMMFVSLRGLMFFQHLLVSNSVSSEYKYCTCHKHVRIFIYSGDIGIRWPPVKWCSCLRTSTSLEVESPRKGPGQIRHRMHLQHESEVETCRPDFSWWLHYCKYQSNIPQPETIQSRKSQQDLFSPNLQ